MTRLAAILLLAIVAFSQTSSTTVPHGIGGSWTMASGDFQNTRFSQLSQITRANVSGLHLVWSFETGLTRGHEAAPLVVGDTMYVVTPFPNILYAFDLKQNGKVKWSFKPDPAPASQ